MTHLRILRLYRSIALSHRAQPLRNKALPNLAIRHSSHFTMGQPLFEKYKLEPLHPKFIPSLQQPKQQILWIGCSDSDNNETKALDVLPDEILEYRILGNIVINDLSCSTTVRYAVDVLKIKHIVICGHYGCGIVNATSTDGLQDPWRSVLDRLHSSHLPDLHGLPEEERDRRFVLLNISEQIKSIRQFPEVYNALNQGNLEIHGVLYDRPNGIYYRIPESLK